MNYNIVTCINCSLNFYISDGSCCYNCTKAYCLPCTDLTDVIFKHESCNYCMPCAETMGLKEPVISP